MTCHCRFISCDKCTTLVGDVVKGGGHACVGAGGCEKSLFLPLNVSGSLNLLFKKISLKNRSRGFPGGAVVENPPANAGDTGSSPGLGRSHMPRSNWAREPQLLSLCIWSLCSATREAAIVRGPRTAMKWPPLAATRESPRTETKTQHNQK